MQLNNQPSSPSVTTDLSQPFLQDEVIYRTGMTIFTDRRVTLSLDADEHLRVYEIDATSHTRKQLFDFSASEISRVYAMRPQLVIQTDKKYYRFTTSNDSISSQSKDARFGNKNTPVDIWMVDIWIDMLRNHQFPVRLSKIDNLYKKFMAHLFLSALIMFVVLIVILFVVAIIVVAIEDHGLFRF